MFWDLAEATSTCIRESSEGLGPGGGQWNLGETPALKLGSPVFWGPVAMVFAICPDVILLP